MDRYVPASGDVKTAEVIVVGEQPGRSEVFKKKPFVGPSGSLLRDLMRFVRFDSEVMYLTNVFKALDEPLDAYIQKPKTGKPILSEKGEFFIRILQDELKEA